MNRRGVDRRPAEPGKPEVQRRLRILLIAGRGEVLRNFLYSDTLPRLAEEAEVTVLSVIDDDHFLRHFRHHTVRVVRLEEHPPPRFVVLLRTLVENAHDRWLWSTAKQNHWELRGERAAALGRRTTRRIVEILSRLLGFRPILRLLTRLEQELHVRLRTTREFDELLDEIRPDLVFNGSHIHGVAAELPCRLAQHRGIPTAGFLFSWDNLTTQTRVMVPYDDYLVWTETIRREFLKIYPEVDANRVKAVGTPQFDFHERPDFLLSREEICREIGIDPARPFVLYTTGIDDHFPQEHHHVARVAELLDQQFRDADEAEKPQLVVRTYAKGTSREMNELARSGLPHTVFPPVHWNEQWMTPEYEDLSVYSSLLRHCSLGINAASTVSLELMMFDKPVINLRHDPPGTDLPWSLGYERHILFDHYRPVAESGAVMVAASDDDLARMLLRGLREPDADAEARKVFLADFFGGLLDGKAGRRVGDLLLDLARGEAP